MRSLLLLLLCAPAFGQTAYPFAVPTCVPESVGGTGKGISAIDVAEGTCRGYWCPAGTGWKAWDHCVLQAYKTPSINTALNLAVTATNPVAGLAGFVTATQVAPKTADVAAYNALHDKMQAALLLTRPVVASAPPPPPPAAYTVKTNGAALDRPAYLLTNGVRGTTSVGRALVNQPCSTTLPSLASGLDLWASFGPDFVSGKVALCAKTP